MRKTLLIVQREYNAAVRTKAFILMLIMAPIMMGGGLLVLRLMKDRVDTTDKRIAIVDRSGVIAPALLQAAEARNAAWVYDPQTGKKIRPVYLLEIVRPNDDDPDAQRVRLSSRVRRRELAAFVEIGKDVVHPGDDPEVTRITYHAENAIMDDARRWIRQPINDQIRMERAVAAGIEPQRAQSLFTWMPVEGMGLVTVDEETGAIRQAQRSDEGRAFGVPLVLLMMMFMMIMVGAAPLVNAVLEEKMQRIAEVLLGSVRPFQLMMGKLLGTLAVSFTVLAIYMGGGIALLYHLDYEEYIPFGVLPWFLLYMVAAILLFGSLLIALGSACNDIKEAQSMMMPVWLLMMVPMMVWFPIVREPLGSFATGMSLIPPFTPILMLLRQTTPGGVPAWQPWVGLTGVLICTVLCVWAAGRIFRVGLLMQGKPPKLADILRWAIRG